MRTKYNRSSHLEPKVSLAPKESAPRSLSPKSLTLISARTERKRVPIKAITKQYVIVSVDDGEEQVYEISSGLAPNGYTKAKWYYIANRSLEKLLAFIKGS